MGGNVWRTIGRKLTGTDRSDSQCAHAGARGVRTDGCMCEQPCIGRRLVHRVRAREGMVLLGPRVSMPNVLHVAIGGGRVLCDAMDSNSPRDGDLQGQRDPATGRWTLLGSSASPVFREALELQLNALDPVFARAQATSDFEFILSLLRVRGLSFAPDPYETTLRAIPLIEKILGQVDAEAEKHLALWMYGHIFEADEPYELLANLTAVAGGGRYSMDRFPPRNDRRQSPGEKIRQLQQMATINNLGGAFDLLSKAWDRDLRNAAFHADYAITQDCLQLGSPFKKYAWDDFNNLMNRALAYHVAHSSLFKFFIGTYREPEIIAVPAAFSTAPGVRAWVMVREGYGAVGIKDAWSPEEIRRGQIPFHIARLSAEESRMATADPGRVLFPRE